MLLSVWEAFAFLNQSTSILISTSNLCELSIWLIQGGGDFAAGIFRHGGFRVLNFCEVSPTISCCCPKYIRFKFWRNFLSNSCLCHTLSLCRQGTVKFYGYEPSCR